MATIKEIKVDPQFGKRFRSAWFRSEYSELNQKELSELFNVSQQTVSSWLHSTRYPFIDTGIQIATKFVVNMDLLYVGREPRVPKDHGPYDTITYRLMSLTDDQIVVLDLIIGLFEKNTLCAKEINDLILGTLRSQLLNKA